MSSIPDYVLLGDIGATNARFALMVDRVLCPMRCFDVASYSQFADLLRKVLSSFSCRPTDLKALFAVAAPVQGERVVLTNASWVIDTAEIHKLLGIQCQLINDFEAVAYSLPQLQPGDLTRL